MGDFTVACPKCSSKFRLKEAYAKINKQFKCIKCGMMISLGAGASGAPAASPQIETVPAPSPAAPAPALAAAPAPAPVVTRPAPAPVMSAPAATSGTDAVVDGIVFCCPKCSREMRVPKIHAGKKGRCKQCGTIATIPAASVLPPPATEAPVPAPLVIEPVAKPLATQPRDEPPANVNKLPVAPLARPASESKSGRVPSADVVPAPIASSAPIAPIAPRASAEPSDVFNASANPLHARITHLDAELAVAQRRASVAESELQALAGQRMIESMGNQRRIVELESEIRNLRAAVAQKAAETSELEAKVREQLKMDVTAELQTLRAGFIANLQNYSAAAERHASELNAHIEKIKRG